MYKSAHNIHFHLDVSIQTFFYLTWKRQEVLFQIKWSWLTHTHTFVLFPVLKADQTSILKFPVSPLSCSLGAPLGSALLSGAAGLQVGSSSHHLPLDLHLRGKLDPGGDAVSKTKKGRRSRTVFTELQLMGLEKRFEKQKYLSTPDR